MKSLFKMLAVVCLLGAAYGQTVNAGRFGLSIVSPQLCNFTSEAWICGTSGLVNFNAVLVRRSGA